MFLFSPLFMLMIHHVVGMYIIYVKNINIYIIFLFMHVTVLITNPLACEFHKVCNENSNFPHFLSYM